MKRILLLLVLCLNISMVLGQEYKNWDKYDIEGFYTIAKSKAEAKISKNVLREGADYYIPTEMDDQVFPSGISKKITPKLYKLKDTEIYVFFTFPPFLYDSDNGMIEIKTIREFFIKVRQILKNDLNEKYHICFEAWNNDLITILIWFVTTRPLFRKTLLSDREYIIFTTLKYSAK